MNFVIPEMNEVRNSMSHTATITPHFENFCIRFDD